METDIFNVSIAQSSAPLFNTKSGLKKSSLALISPKIITTIYRCLGVKRIESHHCEMHPSEYSQARPACIKPTVPLSLGTQNYTSGYEAPNEVSKA